jgi:hypothetical protein
MKLFRRPSPAMVVALLGLFVALAGTGVAATGGTFILGRSNSADQTTELSSNVAAGPTLSLVNTGGKPAARFRTISGVRPFSVDQSARVPNLNADLLDGRDSTYFLPTTGKAANADKLDGLDSLSFTQGGGHVYSGHVEDVAVGGQGTLLTAPGSQTITYDCENGQPHVTIQGSSLGLVIEPNGEPPYFAKDGTSWFGDGAVFLHILASRPFISVLKPRLLSDVVMAGGWDSTSSTCTFQAVATSFF